MTGIAPSPDSAFLHRLARRVLVFDGAMGTHIHALELPLADYRNLENCSEILNLTRPDAIERIHRDYLAAGCDAVETNTFGANRVVLAEFGLADQTYELNVAAARIARRAVAAFDRPDWPRFVAGSVGPGTRLISLRQIGYDELLASYTEQVRGLLDGGVDVLVVETCQDILQAKVAIQAVRQAAAACGRQVPLIVQVTMETTGTMLVGTDLAAAVVALEAYPEVDVIGLNCATGPAEMSEHVRFLARTCTRPLSVMPNAGLPQVVDGRPYFPLTPEELARWLREFVETNGVRIVGGCCGTTPAHVAAVVAAVRQGGDADTEPRPGHGAGRDADRAISYADRAISHEAAVSSLYSAVPLRQETSFLIVGERCNTNGSRQFKKLVEAGDVEGMVAMAREQVAEGAHVLDVCVDYVGREGAADMVRAVTRLASDVNAPLMLDSTQVDVLEAGLKLAGGKCIVNSVNLEDGEERVARIARLLRQYGAAVVALTIDEDPREAMAKTADRKLAIAARLHDLLTRAHGLNEEDIFFDCLTFPITTGNAEDRRLALETLDGIARVMARFPRCQSILGVSNVSFGLQPAARVVLNSAFLSEAVRHGLTAAIVHAGKILPRSQISDERWQAALDLIHDRREGGDPLTRFIGLFSAGEEVGAKVRIADLPVDERLKRRIIDGERTGLEADLDEALRQHPPLHIINEFLLGGMKVVGELFASGAMQLPFVLRSAETMKAAVTHLEPHMERVAGRSRGSIVLATVRGDVHDIGKNLVDIILTNNGYTVHNLGIKQPIGHIIQAWQEHQADAIGLSGLLVKSTLVMREDLEVLNEQGITVPVILGGAALTRRYVEEDLRGLYQGEVHYAKDAFAGLALMQNICAERAGAATRPGGAAAGLSPEPGAQRRASVVGGETTAASESLAAPGAAAGAPGTSGQVVAGHVPAPTRVAAHPPRHRPIPREDAERRFGLSSLDDDARSPTAKTEGEARPPGGARSCAPSTRARADETIRYEHPVPQPPFWGTRVLERIDPAAPLAYINETMLFQVQWGFRKQRRAPEDWRRYVAREIRPIYRELVARCKREEILRPQAIYGYWPAGSAGNDLVVFAPPPPGGPADAHGPELLRFHFPRQQQAPGWCLADFWRPLAGGVTDVLAAALVTAGRRVTEVAHEWFARVEYREYLFLHGLGVELAEALAEYVHKQVRSELGIGERDARELQKLFQQGYQGSRYSFGYPACPRLEDQALLMKLLEPQRIGVTLSEGCMLDPEQSTSALIAYHPQARYFNVRQG